MRTFFQDLPTILVSRMAESTKFQAADAKIQAADSAKFQVGDSAKFQSDEEEKPTKTAKFHSARHPTC